MKKKAEVRPQKSEAGKRKKSPPAPTRKRKKIKIRYRSGGVL
jgi:hypothetical protein